MEKDSKDSIDYSYTDITKETMRYKEPFCQLDKKRNHSNKKRMSQIYLLKLAFAGEDGPKSDELTYFQKYKYIQGPASLDRFHGITLQEKRKALEDFIILHSDEMTRVLDAGCNTGVEGYRLYSRGFRGIYIGVDNNLKSLIYALDNLEGTPSSITLADLSEINYPDNYFDIVFTIGVLEGLQYYKSVLKELSRLTSKWLVIAPYIYMTDEPDLIKKHDLIDVYANRYNRKKMFEFLSKQGMQNPHLIYQAIHPELGPQEIIVFEKETSS